MMTPPSRTRPNDMVLTPVSDAMAAVAVGTASSGWISTTFANQMVHLMPIYLQEPFPVAKAFWCNGATVGSDYLDIGVYRMTDPVTGRCDLLRSTGPIPSGIVQNVVQEAGWPVIRAFNVTSGNSSTDATSYAMAAVRLSAGKLYLLSVENSAASADVVSSITGSSPPTFTSRSSTQYNGTANRVSIWSAVPSVDFSGVLTIDFGANTETGCVWSLEEFSGVDTASTDGIVQQAVGTGTSVTPLATLGAFGSVYNETFGAHGHAAATATTPKAGFQELADATAATPAQALETEWASMNDTAVSATISSAAWGSCAVEIKANTSVPAQPWRVASANLTSGTGSGTTGTTASVTLKAGRLYLLAVENRHIGGSAEVCTVSGGPTFTSRQTLQITGDATRRLTVFSAVPTVDYTGTLTLNFGGNSQSAIGWVLDEFSGVDTSSNDGIVQSVTGTGSSAAVALATLSAFGSAGNATYGAFGLGSGNGITAGIGFRPVIGQTVTGVSVATEWRVDPATSVDVTFAATTWAAIALEIKADTSPFVIPASTPGSPDLYMALVKSGATATIQVSHSNSFGLRWSGYMRGTAGTLTTLPSSLIASTSPSFTRPLCGFSRRSLLG